MTAIIRAVANDRPRLRQGNSAWREVELAASLPVILVGQNRSLAND